MADVPVKSLKKALDLLSLLVFDDPEQRGIELTTLANRLGLPTNTAHNLLKTMTVCGYVAQNAAGRYTSGPKCRQIGLLNWVEGDRFKAKLAAILKRHTAELDEAMVFAVLHGGKRVVLARTEPVGQVIRIDHQVVDEASIYQLPTGRILVAFASAEESRLIQETYGPPGTAWADYEEDIQRIRREGQCLLLPDAKGINAFAVPVLEKNGDLLGAIGCYAPSYRCGRPAQKQIVAALHRVAAELAGV